MRVDVAFKLAGLAGFIEAGGLAAGAFVEGNAQMPGFAAWLHLGGKSRQSRLAIGDGVNVEAFGWRFFAEGYADGMRIRSHFVERVGIDRDLAFGHGVLQ